MKAPPAPPGYRHTLLSRAWPTIVRVTGGALALVVLVFAVTMLLNNRRFAEWKAQLLEHPEPSDSVVVDSGSRFGLLWGNGNHCDGEAWMMLQSDLSQGELANHYADVLVVRFEESHILVEPGEAEGTWRVSARGRIGTAGLDPRCH